MAATLQAALINAGSNVLAQGIKAYKNESERTKPKTDNDKTQKPRLNVKNTVLKITIDQTVGAVWNTVLFIATLGLLRGEAYETILDQIRTVGPSCLRDTVII
ncbi:hypothetical protein ATERTT37_006514 [Aspergillus terreus]